MGYTEKTDRIKETKASLKDNINDLGGNITTSTTFREYSDKLENIYNNLPKIANTNSDITLANTNKGKMVIQPQGNISQDTIAGNQMVDCTKMSNYTNYGLTATVQSDGSIILNAPDGVTHYIDIYVANTNINTEALEKMNTNLGSYSFSNNLSLTSYFRWHDVEATSASYTASTITLTEGQTVTGLFVRIREGDVFNNDVLKVMVNTGSTALDWEQYVGNAPSPNPSYPQDIKVVKGNNSIVIKGINLLNEDLFTERTSGQSVTVTHKDGKMILNGTSPSGGSDITIYNNSPFLTLKAGTYTFLFNEASTNWNCELNLTSYHLGTYKLIKGINNNYRRFVVTFDSDFDIYNINIHTRPNSVFTNQEFWLMILEGEYPATSLPEFEPYKEPIEKELNLGNIELTMIPSHNLVDENNLTKATGTAQIKNKVVTSAVLNSASSVASGFTVKIPTFKPEARYLLCIS